VWSNLKKKKKKEKKRRTETGRKKKRKIEKREFLNDNTHKEKGH